jgi:lysozyme
MNISQVGINLIKSFEGCRLDAYDDLQPKVKIKDKSQVKGTLTIGYGHTGDVHVGQVITQAQADALLLKDLQRYVDPVNKQLKVKVNQHQFDALVSFCYNCGPGAVKNLTDKINHDDFDGAVITMLQYNKSRDKKTGQLVVLSGLARRREAERQLFVRPVAEPKPVAKTEAPKPASKPITAKPVTKPAAPQPVFYIVKKGDSISKIATNQHTTVATLDKLNPSVKNLNLIYPGQKIRVK